MLWLCAGVGTPPTPAPQAAQGQPQIDTPARPAPDGKQDFHQALLQYSAGKQREPSVPMQVQSNFGRGICRTNELKRSLGSRWRLQCSMAWGSIFWRKMCIKCSAMQLYGSGVPLSTQTRAVLGSLESVWAARQPTLSAPAQQHAPAPTPGQPLGSTPGGPTPDQQALLSALLKAIIRHKQPGKPF